jgi:hypothetical protein
MFIRLKKLPVPILPTFVGALTLSNVYGGLGYTWFRFFVMGVATIVVLCYLLKINIIGKWLIAGMYLKNFFSAAYIRS